MQQLAVSLVFALCLAYSGAVQAAYVIKNSETGTSLLRDAIGTRGTQLMFDVPGGNIRYS